MRGQEPKFFTCDTCHVIIEEICGDKGEFTCCNTPLKQLIPNPPDGAREKHLPVIIHDGNCVTVKVGDVFHPMSEAHSIQWVYLKTEKGGQIKYLDPDAEPAATFLLTEEDRPVAAYAYCNLHGFWKTEI